jgi:hypothetical protein
MCTCCELKHVTARGCFPSRRHLRRPPSCTGEVGRSGRLGPPADRFYIADSWARCEIYQRRSFVRHEFLLPVLMQIRPMTRRLCFCFFFYRDLGIHPSQCRYRWASPPAAILTKIRISCIYLVGRKCEYRETDIRTGRCILNSFVVQRCQRDNGLERR